MTNQTSLSLLDPALVKPAVIASFAKLSPQAQWRNPVMFVVYVGSIVTTLLGIQALLGQGEAPAWFILTVAVWLWFTVLFANFAESLAEGRSKAQAASLRSLKKNTLAKKLKAPPTGARFAAGPPQGETTPSGGSAAHAVASAGATFSWFPEQAENLRKGDLVLVEAGDTIPVDGESFRAWPPWTRAPSLANLPQSCASRVAILDRSLAVPACCRTGWWCAFR